MSGITLTQKERSTLKSHLGGVPLRLKNGNIELKKGESWDVLYGIEEGKEIAQEIMRKNRTYKAGTRMGKGIAFERQDSEEIQAQKERLGSIIQSRIEEVGSSLRKLEKLTNIHNPQIHSITSGKKNYPIDNFLRVIDALGLEITLSAKQTK